MSKGIDVDTIIGILIAIAVSIFSPNIPQIKSTWILIGGLIFVIIIIAVVILLNIYLDEKKGKDERLENISQENNNIKKELEFLKDRFKTLEDLSIVRAKVDLIEKRIFKR